MNRAFDILHSPFDIETHKSEFVDYLEVCIDRDGVIHYITRCRRISSGC